MTALSQWYGNQSSGSLQIIGPAGDAFQQALLIFNQKVTRDVKKTRRLEALQPTSLEDVVHAVETAQKQYEGARSSNKVSRWLTEVSKRLNHYGNIMDVLVQHHPEYVSLAWGAMKLIFGAIVEHENIGTTIVTGLCDISNALPRVTLATILFPTDTMQLAVANLYAYIMAFLVRALEWYETNSFQRAVHSITKPAALRYDDIIKQIDAATKNVRDEAVMCSHAEQRDIHSRLIDLSVLQRTTAVDHQVMFRNLDQQVRHLTDRVEQLQLHIDVAFSRTIQSSAHLSVDYRLSPDQLMKALNDISHINHQTDLVSAQMARRRHQDSGMDRCSPFWSSSRLRVWDIPGRSTQISLVGSWKDRHVMMLFCTNIIDQLQANGVAILWIFKTRDQTFSVMEVLQSLIKQTLTQKVFSSDSDLLSSRIHTYLSISTEKEYFDLLQEILKAFRLAYIVVDMDAIAAGEGERLYQLFGIITKVLGGESPRTVLKVLFASYGPRAQSQIPDDSVRLWIEQTSRQKAKRLPTRLLGSRGSFIRRPLVRAYEDVSD